MNLYGRREEVFSRSARQRHVHYQQAKAQIRQAPAVKIEEAPAGRAQVVPGTRATGAVSRSSPRAAASQYFFDRKNPPRGCRIKLSKWRALRKVALGLLLAASGAVLLLAALELWNFRQWAYLAAREPVFSEDSHARILQDRVDLLSKRVGDMELLVLILLGTSGLYAIVFVASSYVSATQLFAAG